MANTTVAAFGPTESRNSLVSEHLAPPVSIATTADLDESNERSRSTSGAVPESLVEDVSTPPRVVRSAAAQSTKCILDDDTRDCFPIVYPVLPPRRDFALST